MKTIEYTSTGEAVSDSGAEARAEEFLKSNQESISVSTENFVLAARTLVGEGKFPHDQVVFLYDGDEIHPDPDGRLPRWPRGFCDYFDGWLSRLLNSRFKR